MCVSIRHILKEGAETRDFWWNLRPRHPKGGTRDPRLATKLIGKIRDPKQTSLVEPGTQEL